MQELYNTTLQLAMRGLLRETHLYVVLTIEKNILLNMRLGCTNGCQVNDSGKFFRISSSDVLTFSILATLVAREGQ